MYGAFRYTKSIVASLLLAAVGFGMRYGQSYLFSGVASPPAASSVQMMKNLPAESQSPQRTLTADGAVRWQIAVATNRSTNRPQQTAASAATTSLESTAQSSLFSQSINAVYHMPDPRFALANVTMPALRPRGSCELNADALCAVQVGSAKDLPPSTFLTHVLRNLTEALSKDVLVYVHGFNVTQEQAIARAAQFAEDMPFNGIIIAYDWNSAGQVEAYRSDEVSAERHFWGLSELLAQLRQRCPADTRLHILAHSMGNRVVLRALQALTGKIDPVGRRDSLGFARYFRDPQQNSASTAFRSVGALSPSEIKQRFFHWGSWNQPSGQPPIQSLILAAPDVSVGEFCQAIQDVRPICQRLRLYASDTDYALDASSRVNGGSYRAGDSRARLRLEDVEVIHFTGVTSQDRLGHSYYGSDPAVLDQLAEILRPPIDLTQPLHKFAVGMPPTDRR